MISYSKLIQQWNTGKGGGGGGGVELSCSQTNFWVKVKVLIDGALSESMGVPQGSIGEICFRAFSTKKDLL